MPVTRPRTLADIRRDLEYAEDRSREVFARWEAQGTLASVSLEGPSREQAQTIEEILRHMRGAQDRLILLWLEYSQISGIHAPQ